MDEKTYLVMLEVKTTLTTPEGVQVLIESILNSLAEQYNIKYNISSVVCVAHKTE